MQNRSAITALIAAGTLWGLTAALSKLALEWLDPSWLTALRFCVAAPLLIVLGHRQLRQALTPGIVICGAIGIGGANLLQNAGIEHTSVSHAAVIVGVLPVIVALVAAGIGHARPGRLSWVGYAVALGGIVVVASGSGAGASFGGDMLIFASVVVSAIFIAIQPRFLRGRDAASVTAVQFAASALLTVPVAALTQGLPSAPAHLEPVAAFVALVLAGTVLAFWLFAHGQSHVEPKLAGVFVNLEPLVGAAVGWTAFGDPCGIWQVAGAAAVILGILISAVPWHRPEWPRLASRRHLLSESL